MMPMLPHHQAPPPSWPPGPKGPPGPPHWNHGIYPPAPAPGRPAHGPPHPFGPPTRRGPPPPEAHRLPPPRPPHPGRGALPPPPASEPGTGFYNPRPRARPPPSLHPYGAVPPQHSHHPLHPQQVHAPPPRALTPPMSVYSAHLPPHGPHHLDEDDDEMEMEMDMEMAPPPPPGPALTAYRTPTRANFPPLTRSATEVPYRRPISHYAPPDRHGPPALPSAMGGATTAYPPISGRPARRRYSASAYGYPVPDDASVYSAPPPAPAPAPAPGYAKGFGREPRYPAAQSEYGGEMYAPARFQHSRHGSYSHEPPPAWDDEQYAPALGLGAGLTDSAYAPPQHPSALGSAPPMRHMTTAPPLGRHAYTPPEDDPYAPPATAPPRAITYAPAQTETRPRRNSSRSYPGFCTLPRAPNPNDSSESDQTESEAESENYLPQPSRPDSPADGPSKRRLIKELGWSDRKTDEWLAQQEHTSRKQGEKYRSRKPQLQLTSKSSRHTSRTAISRGRKSRPVSKAPTSRTERSKSRFATPAPSRSQSKYRSAPASNYGEESRSPNRSQSQSQSRSRSRARLQSSAAASRSASKFRTPAGSSYGGRSQSRGRSGYGVRIHTRSRSRHGLKSKAESEDESESESEQDTASESGSDTGSESEDEATAEQSESEEAPKYHSFVYEGVEEEESQTEHGHSSSRKGKYGALEPEIEEEDDEEEGYYDYGGDEYEGYEEPYDYHPSYYRRPGTGAARRQQPQPVRARRGRR